MVNKIGKVDWEYEHRNIDKTWGDIIREIEKDPDVLWHYITALRGPDVDLPYVKEIFTCPLRGRGVQALDVEDFLVFDAEKIMHGFSFAFESRRELRHYIQHVISVWKDFYPSIAHVLEDVFFVETVKPEDGAVQYVKLVNEWLESKNVIMCKR